MRHNTRHAQCERHCGWDRLLAPLLVVVCAASPLRALESGVLSERLDRYDPTSGAFLGTEQTWFSPDGLRLRWQITDEKGQPSLIFFVMHDSLGRESEALYFEGGGEKPWREVLTYDPAETLQTTTYYPEPGQAGEVTESIRDANGREVRKRYFRKDGSQYGKETVLWDDRGRKRGWDFRYVGREGGASFRYEYEPSAESEPWKRRVRSRDGVAEWIEVRTLARRAPATDFMTPQRLLPGVVSTDASETSPSFARDGRTMVFARYGDDWTVKQPWIATLTDGGWQVEALEELGAVYNVSMAPDAQSLFYSKRTADSRSSFRVRRQGDAWSDPENLTQSYGIRGTYLCLDVDGTLWFYDGEGSAGNGVYRADPEGNGFAAPQAVYVPNEGAPFDPDVLRNGDSMLVTRCFDDTCDSGPRNGIWEIDVSSVASSSARKLPTVPYGWGAQRVPSLGLLVFTDGEDILALPLRALGLQD